MTVAPVEIEIGRERLGLLVEDEDRAVLIDHKESIGAAGLLADGVHSSQ
jgi:hypothetical protein